MNSFNKIIRICESYVEGQYGIEEFQQRLETVLLPDDCKNTLEILLHNATNRLEAIRFSYFPENQKEHADQIIAELALATV